MPIVNIPLVGSITERGPDGEAIITAAKDQEFINCVFRKRVNPATGKVTFSVEKRSGVTTLSTPQAAAGAALCFAFLGGGGTNASITAFGAAAISASGTTSSCNMYVGTDPVGVITGSPFRFVQSSFNNKDCLLMLTSSAPQTGWYLYGDATFANTTGNTTNASAVITNIPSTIGFYTGQAISGTNIPANTRILTVDSATQVTNTANSTGTTAGVTISHNAVAKIIDVDFPSNCVGNPAYLDGYMFVVDASGKLSNSDINNPSGWTSTSFISTNFFGESVGVSLIRFRNFLIAFTNKTGQVFYNAGNTTGSPLGRVENAAFNIGIANGDAYTILENVLYFIGTDGPNRGLYAMSGLTPQKISTPDVDAVLATEGSFPVLSSGHWGGTPVVLIGGFPCTTLDATFKKLVYQPDTSVWSEWTGVPIAKLADPNTGSTSTYTIDTSGTAGNIYLNNPLSPVWQDSGTAITATARTSRMDLGTNKRKFVNSIRLRGADVQTSGTATLEKSDDDYANWTTLGTFDLTSMNPAIFRCGSHVGGRAYRLTHSANTAFAASHLEIDYSVAN